FLIRVSLGYADLEGELEILARFGQSSPLEQLEPVTGPEELVELRRAARSVHTAEEVRTYLVRLVQRTREHPDLALGGSARASLGLLRGAQARALLLGRDYVIPDDIKELTAAVLTHRLVLRASAELRGATPAEVVTEVLATEPVPVGGRRAAG
ncbi:MAG: AAA family ATPase, partial [Candidatus Dormibacteria bacterium]